MIYHEDPEKAFRRLRATGRATLPSGRVEGRLAAAAMGSRARTQGLFQEDIASVLRGPSEGRLSLSRGRGTSVDRRILARQSPEAVASIDDMAARRRTAASQLGPGGGPMSDVSLAWPKMRDPFDDFRQKSWWWLDNNDFNESLRKVREWARLIYMTHHLVPSLIDIYARFPLLDVRFRHPDQQIVDFYEELFLNQLDYQEFLYDLNREFWTVGEAFALGSWHEGIGAWDADELINPDDVVVAKNAALRQYQYHLKVPESIRNLVRNKEPREEYETLVRDFPYLIEWANRDEEIPVSDTVMKHLKFKTTPWSEHGVPILMRAFRALMHEESLNSAQDAVADRLYSPLILAKLGLDDVDQEGPWIPDPSELEALRDDLSLALMSDFRLMVYHHGLDISSVFGKEQMPKMNEDFDRVDGKLLQIFGVGKDLLQGASSSTYASGALNRELLTQMLTTSQVYVKRFLRERMEVVADAQGHYEYERHGDRSTPVMERALMRDEETGEEYVVERPKLAVPEVIFKTMNMRDEKTEREFLKQLDEAGIPISARTKLTNVPVDFSDELEAKFDEQLEQVIAEAEFKRALFKRIAASMKGDPHEALPVPAALESEFRAWLSGGEQPLVQGEVAEPLLPQDLSPSLLPPQDGQTDEEGGVVVDMNGQPVQPGANRPEVSDEQRADSPRAAARRIAAAIEEQEAALREAARATAQEAVPEEPGQYDELRFSNIRLGAPHSQGKRRLMTLPRGIVVRPAEDEGWREASARRAAPMPSESDTGVPGGGTGDGASDAAGRGVEEPGEVREP